MADTKISALSGATALAGTEAVPIIQSATTKKATADQIGDRVIARYGLTLNNATVSDPTVNSDGNAGYAASSVWLNTTTGAAWYCRSASVGAAVWERLDLADHPGYLSGQWYPSVPNGTMATGSAFIANAIRLAARGVEHDVVGRLAARLSVQSDAV